MKAVALLLLFATVAFATPAAPAPSTAEDSAVDYSASVVDAAAGLPELSTLVAAVQLANLTADLDALAEGTVLAPNNGAFVDLLKTLNLTSATQIPKDVLTDVLLYHVIPVPVFAANLTAGPVETLLAGEPINVKITKGVPSFVSTGGVTANVVTKDIEVAEGLIVHIIDKVLLPKL